MALKLTVYIGGAGEDPGDSQEDLNKLADRILRIANKHADFYAYRSGNVTVEPREEEE